MNILSIIPILLTLGSQPECDGFGICALENLTPTIAEECDKYENCIRAEIEYTDNELVLIVSQNNINNKAFIKYFTKEYFEFDKDFQIPDDIIRLTDCPSNSQIEKGKYPINEEDGKIVVRFKL